MHDLRPSPVAPSGSVRPFARVGAYGSGALAVGAATFAACALGAVAGAASSVMAPIGFASAIVMALGGLALAAAWFGHILRGRGGVGPFVGALAVPVAIGALQLAPEGLGGIMLRGLLLVGGLLVCTVAHGVFPLGRGERGSGLARVGSTLAVAGLGMTLVAYSRSFDLPLVIAMGFLVLGLVGITFLGCGLALGLAARARA